MSSFADGLLVSVVFVIVVLVATVNAVPSQKLCTEQAGSDALGVPTVNGGFHAMATEWAVETAVDDGFFRLSPNNDAVLFTPPDTIYGFFAITSSG